MIKWFADRLARTGDEVRKDEHGFTLIELLVVVIIIGILAAIAIPTFLGQRADAADSRAEANLRAAATAQQAYYAETGSYGDQTAVEDGDLNDSGWPNGADPAVTVEDAGDESYCLETTGADNDDTDGEDTFSISNSNNAPVEEACS